MKTTLTSKNNKLVELIQRAMSVATKEEHHENEIDGKVENCELEYEAYEEYEVYEEYDDEYVPDLETDDESSCEDETTYVAPRTVTPIKKPETSKYVPVLIGHTERGQPMYLMEDGTVKADISISGTYFRNMFGMRRVVKLTNESCVHNGFEFKEGYNEDTSDFKYDVHCGNGLYFCIDGEAYNWLEYNDKNIAYVWDVYIPDDARVVVYKKKMKADKFILMNKRPVHTLYLEIIDHLIKTCNETRIITELRRYARDERFIADMQTFYNVQDRIDYLISIFPRMFTKIPELFRSRTACLHASKAVPNAYEFMPITHKYDPQIVCQCIALNRSVYFMVPDELKTQKLAGLQFAHHPKTYGAIESKFKTEFMSETYLKTGGSYENVPVKHLNALIDVALEYQPDSIRYIEFRNLDEDKIVSAIEKSNGLSVKRCVHNVDVAGILAKVPFTMRSAKVCESAVLKAPVNIAYVPYDCLTNELIEKFILKFPVYVGTIFSTCGHEEYKQRAHDIVSRNALELIKVDSASFRYLYKNDYLTDDLVREAIRIDPKVYNVIRDVERFKTPEFKLEVVCAGGNFGILASNDIVYDDLVTIVKARKDAIDTIPVAYVSDDLIIEAINAHGLIYNIPESMMTPKLEEFVKSKEAEDLDNVISMYTVSEALKNILG